MCIRDRGQSAQYPKEEDAFHVGVNYVKSGTFDTYQVEGYYTIPADASLIPVSYTHLRTGGTPTQ